MIFFTTCQHHSLHALKLTSSLQLSAYKTLVYLKASELACLDQLYDKNEQLIATYVCQEAEWTSMHVLLRASLAVLLLHHSRPAYLCMLRTPRNRNLNKILSVWRMLNACNLDRCTDPSPHSHTVCLPTDRLFERARGRAPDFVARRAMLNPN